MKLFDICYGISELPDGAEVIYRKACKAVVRRDNKVLLIHTNKGDYKFPGGGYEKGEDSRECLSRELMEETGYRLVNVGELLGCVVEQNPDKFEPEKYFSMKSEYYSVEIDEFNQENQKLDEYEKEQKFKPVFENIDEAIRNNQEVLRSIGREQNPWVRRETEVLSYLAKMK